MIRAVLFDLDGTLIDSFPAIAASGPLHELGFVVGCLHERAP